MIWLLCVAHTLVEQMFSFMASCWDQWPWSNWLLKRAKRIIWSTGHSLRTRVLVGHICGHHEATVRLGWGREVEADVWIEFRLLWVKCPCFLFPTLSHFKIFFFLTFKPSSWFFPLSFYFNSFFFCFPVPFPLCLLITSPEAKHRYFDNHLEVFLKLDF